VSRCRGVRGYAVPPPSRVWRYLGGVGTFAELRQPDSPLTGSLALDGLILPVYLLPGAGGKRPAARVMLAATGEELGAVWSKQNCISGQVYVAGVKLGIVGHPDRQHTPDSEDWRMFQFYAIEDECQAVEKALDGSSFDVQYADPF